MGWSSGSSLMSDLIEAVRDHFGDVDPEIKIAFFQDMIDAFSARDCDTLDECKGEDASFDEAYEGIYGSDEEEDPDE